MGLASPSSCIDYSVSSVTFSESTYLSFSTLTAIFGSETVNSGLSGTISTSSLTGGSDTSLSYVDDSYQNTDAESFTGLVWNTYMSEFVHFTCFIGSNLDITYSILQSGAYSFPSWVDIDISNSKIVGTTSSLSKHTTYKFYIKAESSAWSSGLIKEIALTVLKCK